VDHRGDLYSLGCVLYRLATGAAPFQGPDAMSILKKVLLDTPRPLLELNPEAPPELAGLVARLMAKDPGIRPGRAQLVADSLATLEEKGRGVGRTVRPADDNQPEGPTKTSRGTPGWVWALSGGGGALVLALAVGAFLLTRTSARPTPADPPPPPPPAATPQPPADDIPRGWLAISPPGGRFTALFPGEPKETKAVSQTERGPIENHTLAIEVGASTYAVSWFDFPGVVPQGPQIKGALEGGQKGLLEKLGPVKVVKDREIALDGFPGKEVVVEDADKRFTLTVRLYLVRQRLYTLFASSPLGQPEGPDVRRFFASFRLVE
jgi:hypothetical protein